MHNDSNFTLKKYSQCNKHFISLECLSNLHVITKSPQVRGNQTPKFSTCLFSSRFRFSNFIPSLSQRLVQNSENQDVFQTHASQYLLQPKVWGQSQQLENGCGVGFQSPKVILTSFKMCSHPSNLTVLCSFLCKAFLPCPGKNNATPYPAVPTNSTFSFPCYSTFHTVLEFTFLSPASL